MAASKAQRELAEALYMWALVDATVRSAAIRFPDLYSSRDSSSAGANITRKRADFSPAR
jgi:hypothetical protein